MKESRYAQCPGTQQTKNQEKVAWPGGKEQSMNTNPEGIQIADKDLKAATITKLNVVEEHVLAKTILKYKISAKK